MRRAAAAALLVALLGPAAAPGAGAAPGEVTRLAGASRYETAAAISRAAFAPGAPVAFVATGENWPDALGGGPAAGVAGGPLLLVRRDGVPAATLAELRRLRPQRVVVLGGAAVVSDAVLAQIARELEGW